MEITIGRDSGNSLHLKGDASISRKHAKGTFDGESILIKSIDKASIEINGERRKSGKVYESDTLKIGNTSVNLVTLFSDLRNQIRTEKTEFIEEFSLLVPRFVLYEKKKNKISDGSNKMNQIIKILITVGVLIVVFFGGVPDHLKYPLMISSGLVVGVFSIFSTSSGKKKEKLELLQAEFEHELICPACQRSLIGKGIAYYKKKKKCPMCKAKFFE